MIASFSKVKKTKGDYMEKVKMADVKEIINSQLCEEYVELDVAIPETDKKIKVVVNKRIPLRLRNKVIKGICDLVFVGEEFDIYGFQPGVIEFAKRWAVLSNLTNLTLPNDLNTLYEFAMYTDIYGRIEEAVPEVVNICYEAERLIKTYRDAAIQKINFKPIIDKIMGAMDGLIDKFKDIDINEIGKIISNLKGVDTSNIIETLLKLKKEDKAE